MIRTVIALGGGEHADSICSALEQHGVEVRYRCRTGAEVIRAIRKMGGGVVLCPFKLPDMTADTLSSNLSGIASLLVIAKPQYLELCEDEDLFKIPVPVRMAELIGAVNMLLQMDRMRAARAVPKRSAEDQALIAKAKELLMERNGLTEAAAHRYLQRRSMETCARMEETAKIIIDALE